MSCLCLQVYISQMRRGSSDCDQVPRRMEFHEHKQLEASCKQKTLLTCKSTHKDNKYLSKIQLFICGNIWLIFLHKKKSIFEFDDYSKKCFLDISNNFTVERWPVLLFFSWHIKQTDQKALSLHLTAIVWANSFSAPFCSSITLNITVAAFYLSHPFSHHCHPHHYRPMPSWMPGQSSFLFRWTSSAQRAADWIYKHKEMCSLIQSGYPWQGIFGWNTIF